MKLPRELIIYILEIKSFQAWKERLSHLHTMLEYKLTADHTVIHWINNTVVYINNFGNLDITIEETPDIIFIRRTIGSRGYTPTEYIARFEQFTHSEFGYVPPLLTLTNSPI